MSWFIDDFQENWFYDEYSGVFLHEISRDDIEEWVWNFWFEGRSVSQIRYSDEQTKNLNVQRTKELDQMMKKRGEQNKRNDNLKDRRTGSMIVEG